MTSLNLREITYRRNKGKMSVQLLHGDCLELMKTLPDKSISLFLCDLPYGCLESATKKDAVGCAWDIKLDLVKFWEQVERLAKDEHTPVIHFCNARFGFELYNSKPDWFRYDLVWRKSCPVGFLQANRAPLRVHENIYVFAKKGASYYRKDIEGDFPGTSSGRGKVGGSVYGCASLQRKNPIERLPTREGVRCVTSVVDSANPRQKGRHPTQKPAELYKFLIERYSKEGDTILDPTAGSFTSVFTAKELGRNGIGIEKDDAFYKTAIEKQI